MRRVKFRITGCRRGVSTIIAGIFMVIVFLLIIVTQVMIQAQQSAYFQAMEERSQRDHERFNEKIEIVYARVDFHSLNITVTNNGTVIAHLVDVLLRAYSGFLSNDPLWQRLYEISVYVEPGRSVSFSPPDTFDEDLGYSLKIVTERGNIASVRVPYPPLWEEEWWGGGSGGNIPIVVVPGEKNFQYMDKASAASYFESAYVKPISGTNHHVIYRVLVNNTTTIRIYLLENCTMVQISVATGNIRVRYIASDEWGEKEGSESGIFDETPAPFQSQSLGVGGNGKAYLYFAGDEIDTPVWDDDPDKKYQTVGFILWFRYQGETEARSISLPALIQYLQ